MTTRSRLDRFDKAVRLAELALTPGGLNALVRWRPFSLSAFRLVHGLSLEGLRFQTVIDVGASVGKFSRAAIGVWPDAEVIAFEALPAAAAALRSTHKRARHLEVHEVALGARDGTIPFYPHDYALSSSALPVPPDVQTQHAWARESPPIEVPVRRLDGILASRTLAAPILIKLDVQGYELQVLEGGRRLLDRADAVLIEQSFDSVYAGQPLFGASHQYLEDAGWELARPLDWRRERGKVAEVDCLYLPRH